MRQQRRSDGFSLAEFMVSMVIMIIVISQALLVFSSQQKTYAGQEQVVDIQQDARLVTEVMVADTRMAGFLVANMLSMTGTDGGTGNPDTFCVNDPGVLAEAQIQNATGPFSAASLTSGVGAGATSVTLSATELDIDGDGNGDFSVDQGIILSDGTNHHCARITVVATNTFTFTPATPAGFTLAASSGQAIPAVFYEVAADGLRRNNALLTTTVENLQIEYAVDRDENGAIDPGAGEFPIHDVSVENSDLILGVQIHVMTRTPDTDPAGRGSVMPPAANHTGGAADDFLRRRFTTVVVPRNLK